MEDKMKYYILKPEVAGSFGENTVLDSSVHPPIVDKLHYEFHGWLDSDILTTFPCFIVTDHFLDVIKKNQFTGYAIDVVEVSKSEEFIDMFPGRELMKFHWFKVKGIAGIDDFGISDKNRLVISEKVLKAILKLNIEHCVVLDYIG